MSIYGPYGASIADQEVDLSEYAKRGHVDMQDSLRVMKVGDTMSGDLDMGGHVTRGLPTAYPPLYRGDEAVSWTQVVGLVGDAADTRVTKTGDTMSGILNMGGNSVSGLSTAFPFPAGDETVSRTQALSLMRAGGAARQAIKPIITVWAEENGPIINDQYQWSFGNGASGPSHRIGGYAMLAPGRVLRMGLTLSATKPPGIAEVNLVVNGTEQTSYGVTKPAGQYSGTTTFGTPLELAQGDRLNFRSATPNPQVVGAVVSLLIELDI